MKRGSVVLEYAMLGVVLITTLIIMQSVIKRHLQGHIRQVGEGYFGREYGYGVTNIDTKIRREGKSFFLSLPGWNHPWEIVKTKSTYNFTETKNILPPEYRWEKE